MLTDEARKTTLLHAHMGRHEGYEDAPQEHPQLQLKSFFFSFTQHPPPTWRWLILWDKWKGDPKNQILFSILCLPPPGQRQKGTSAVGVSREVTELSLRCFSTGTRSCRWQQCPFRALHCTHIPWFAHGRGQNPCLPLEISLET